jgi:hypothetical protein
MGVILRYETLCQKLSEPSCDEKLYCQRTVKSSVCFDRTKRFCASDLPQSIVDLTAV